MEDRALKRDVIWLQLLKPHCEESFLSDHTSLKREAVSYPNKSMDAKCVVPCSCDNVITAEPMVNDVCRTCRGWGSY